MATVSETIPEGLQADVSAALAWFNQQQDTTFEVTGIVDAEQSLADSGARELRLVLCGGDRCLQESFQVRNTDNSYEVSQLQPIESAEPGIQAELDPPPGKLRDWLDGVLQQHKFALLVFYRGFW